MLKAVINFWAVIVPASTVLASNSVGPKVRRSFRNLIASSYVQTFGSDFYF